MRPQIKIGDRVRFRTDGEIGQLNKLERSGSMGMTHTVVGVRDGLPVLNDARNPNVTHPNRLDICNDFSGVQVGDVVEVVDNQRFRCVEAKIEKVKAVGGGLFKTENCSSCKGFDFDGKHYYRDGDIQEEVRALRIVEKAKPKPLLAEAKVGDLVKLRNGSYSQIVEVEDGSVFKYQNPEAIERSSVALLFLCDENGDTSRWGKVKDVDIIFTEPLAPEGSAEWAWQMLKLGKSVEHPLEGVLTAPRNYSVERFVYCYPKTGWQIHESKPQFEVGEYVGFYRFTYMVIGYRVSDDHYQLKYPLDGGDTDWYIHRDNLTPVPAKDVELDFGSGIKGRIRRGLSADDVIRVYFAEHSCHHININHLTEPMQTTVKALLERQEVER